MYRHDNFLVHLSTAACLPAYCRPAGLPVYQLPPVFFLPGCSACLSCPPALPIFLLPGCSACLSCPPFLPALPAFLPSAYCLPPVNLPTLVYTHISIRSFKCSKIMIKVALKYKTSPPLNLFIVATLSEYISYLICVGHASVE
jgi:hypothetical protein